LARVVVTPSLRAEFPGGRDEFDVPAASVFDLVRQLDALAPGMAAYIEARVSVAVDGELVADWSTSLTRDSEVLLVPHIAGG
jgi:molybdopterin converting factor small subunit